MAHGGKREGAGRKKGTLNRVNAVRKQQTERILQRYDEEGATPIDVMVQTMRDLWANGEANEENKIKACAIAEKCAPYFHPRLNAIDHSGHIGTHEDALEELE